QLGFHSAVDTEPCQLMWYYLHLIQRVKRPTEYTVVPFLLGGLMIDADDNVYLLDHELASMRQGRAFIAYFNDNVPKTLIGMERLLTSVEARKKVLDPLRFETLVLGAVYSAYQMRRQTSEDVQQAWGGVLARLANTTLHDLRTNAISN
uniref:Protein FAM180A-like n=1 Tax=Scleropages formosus TaxID=113540 RepID=A0A8C9V7R1_SCLFO